MSQKKRLSLCFPVFLLAFSLAASLPTRVSADSDTYKEVDISYLAAHIGDFCGKEVRTTGTVRSMVSIYMYEDFWLDYQVPVVVRFAGLPRPPVNSTIEVCGTIDHCSLEGGFFYFNAHSWEYVATTMPEFQAFVFLPLLMLATLLAAIIYSLRLKSLCSWPS
jgi:hypothetical protein